MLPSYFDYIFVHLKQKGRLKPELSPNFLSTLGANPTRKARPDLQIYCVHRNFVVFLFLFFNSQYFVMLFRFRSHTSTASSSECDAKESKYDALQKLFAKRTKTLVWAAGNCRTTEGAKKRMMKAKQIKKGNISFDIFGGCAKAKYIPPNEFYTTLSEYMFYLSFENSYHCKDYITEKVWFNSFFSGLVPIIWGPHKSDVEDILPNNSFIYLDDFEKISDLVNYLNYLKNNRTAYFEYFRWRLKDPFCSYPLFNNVEDAIVAQTILLADNNKINGFCNLCKKLYDKDSFRTPKVIRSLEKLWMQKERPECIDFK